MLASWVWKGFVSFEAGLPAKKRGGLGGGPGGRAAPPICKHNARIMMGLEGIRMIEASLPPISSGGGCSHDGFGKDSFTLKQAGMALRSGELGGTQPPHLQTQCSHDRLGQDSYAEKRAGTVLKRGGASDGVQPSLHRLQTQCSHDGLGKDSVL